MTNSSLTDLKTRSQIATQLGVSERTLRRTLAKMTGLGCIKVGRQILFRAADVARIERELSCPYTIGNAAKSGMSGARSGSGAKASRYTNTQQAAALDEMQKLLESKKRPASGTRSSPANRSIVASR